MGSGSEIAYFAAGCFWGVEAAFRQVDGVLETTVGYQGGHTINPTYEQVCYEDTMHAEVVAVRFDPSRVSYEELLQVFWKCHDPTTLNRQGPDIGTQYRSAIFYTSSEQKRAAESSKAELERLKVYARPIVTEITEAPDFFQAEEYHQQYLEKRGMATCRI
ncbi:peptide-methionine (S)-S-oxide reductase MsrA [Sneathiella glossodoripedis]|uniref:peptide-methionine (S)-S-oxide reductase MsrA n=1 Tax=Sneathiella glossodoripedis TaxID=418853 RepID=UPI0004711931|nr:peptide-methionine (S)-S-oxide reductase MsrA [Sneathiella glossodoripedis]